MPYVDLSENLSGVGEVTGTLASYGCLLGSLNGLGVLSGVHQQTFLMGGQTRGVGGLTHNNLRELAGTLAGIGSLQGSLTAYLDFKVLFQGLGSLYDSAPLPLSGFGNLQSFLEVAPASKPICQVQAPQELRYMQALSPNDLKLTFCGGVCPLWVTYAFYEVQADGSRVLRGSDSRSPASLSPTRYYATGYVGECGQPGTWVICWTYSDGSTLHTQEQEFKLLAGSPLTNPCGCQTHGWD